MNIYIYFSVMTLRLSKQDEDGISALKNLVI